MEAQQNIQEHAEQVAKILQKAGEMFLSIGIRSVTLEDIARELGISKKTIYQHFANKGELVYECVNADVCGKQCMVQGIAGQELNAIEEMLILGKEVMATLKTFSVNILMDLMKFYPESWHLVEQHKSRFVYQIILQNLQKGKAAGFYRENIQEDITARMYIGYTDAIMMPQGILKNGMSLSELYKEHLVQYMYSICTEKGRQTLEQLLTTI